MLGRINNRRRIGSTLLIVTTDYGTVYGLYSSAAMDRIEMRKMCGSQDDPK